LMMIWIRLFTLMRNRIRIRQFNLIRIRIRLFNKVMQICKHCPFDSPRVHCEPPRLHLSHRGSKVSLHGSKFWASAQLLTFDFDADSALRFDADPKTVCRNYVEPCGFRSGSAILHLSSSSGFWNRMLVHQYWSIVQILFSCPRRP
jgi:hypothetical protein